MGFERDYRINHTLPQRGVSSESAVPGKQTQAAQAHSAWSGKERYRRLEVPPPSAPDASTWKSDYEHANDQYWEDFWYSLNVVAVLPDLVRERWQSLAYGIALTAGIVLLSSAFGPAALLTGLLAMVARITRGTGIVLTGSAVVSHLEKWLAAVEAAHGTAEGRDAARKECAAFAAAFVALSVQVWGLGSAKAGETGGLPAVQSPVTAGQLVTKAGTLAPSTTVVTNELTGPDGTLYPTPRGGSFGASERAPVIDLLEGDRLVDIRVITKRARGLVTIELHTEAQVPLLEGDRDIVVGKVTYKELGNGKIEVDPQSLYVNPGYAGVRQRLAAEQTELVRTPKGSAARTSGSLQKPGIDGLYEAPNFAPSLKKLSTSSSVERTLQELAYFTNNELRSVRILPLEFEANANAGEQFAFSAQTWTVRIDALVLQGHPGVDWCNARLRYAFVRATQCWEVIRYMHFVLKLPTKEIERHFAKHVVAAAIADSAPMLEERQPQARSLHDSMVAPETASALANVEQRNAERDRLAQVYTRLQSELNALEQPLTHDHLARLEKARWEWHGAHLAAMKAADEVARLPHERAAWDASRSKGASDRRKP